MATVVACLAILSIHGQNIPDEYIGSWDFSNEDGAIKTTIEQPNTLYTESFYGGKTTYRIDSWSVVQNPDAATKERFPTGLKIQRTLLSGDVDPRTIGSTSVQYLFPSADKKSAIFGWDNQQGGITVNADLVNHKVVMEEPKREPKTIRREFKTSGNHSFVFNEGFPATVEVYLFGAGGGGQGGHSKNYQQGVGQRTERGNGGGGGGGAAVYAKFEVTGSTTFNMSVGSGGAGGKGLSKPVGGSWESGSPGSAGESTTVRFGSSTLSAGGGSGGGKPGAQNVEGGAGGQAGPAPQGLLDIVTVSGEPGKNGRHNSQEGGVGGSTGLIRKGSIGGSIYGKGGIDNRAPEPGGGGESKNGNTAGGTGGNGRVIFIITY